MLRGAVVLLIGLMSVPVAAAPPVSLRGLGVPTALSFYDRARQSAAVVRRIAPTSDGKSGTESRELRTVETIVIDPGHGDGDSGALGVAGVAEKFLTLELAYSLRERVQREYPDVRVVMTRYTDRGVPLHDRTHLANRIDADLFLSLHYNAAVHQRAVGVETYFLAARQAIPGKQKKKGVPLATSDASVTGIERHSEEEFGIQGDDFAVMRRDLRRARQHLWSGRLAETVQRHLTESIDSVDRGVKQANFAVLRGAMMPAVVVEGGFLSHPEEGRRVLRPEHRTELTAALVDAIEAFDAERARADADTEDVRSSR